MALSDNEKKNKKVDKHGNVIQVEDVTEPPKLEDEFNRVANETQEVLLHLKTAIPFDPFPDEVRVDRQTIIVIRHIFWGVSHTVSSHLDDILNSHVNKGPFFGSLIINTRYLTEDEFTINWLSRNDADKLHKFIQGLMVAKKEELDLSGMPKDELIDKILILGSQV